jgi:hypothetical protein
MKIAVSGNIAKIAAPITRLAGAEAQRAMVQGLIEGGDKVKTKVRKGLRKQTTPLNYSTITTRVAGVRAGMSYIIRATGKGLPLTLFPTRTPGHVEGGAWGHFQTFKRSFVRADGALMARLPGAKRFPVRRTFGPSLPKELVKDQSLSAFEAGVRSDIAPAIEKRLARIVSG